MFGENTARKCACCPSGGKEEGKAKPFSMETLGGTHVKRTGDIGLFKIVHEARLPPVISPPH